MKQLTLTLAALACAAVTHAQSTLLWSQPADGMSSFGPALHSSTPPYDMEIADDFELDASITRVVMYSWSPGVATFQGLTIRFYAADAGGQPAALLRQYEFLPGDPALTYDPALTTLDAHLPRPFRASGHVFVAFEENVNPIYASSANTDHPTLSSFYWRDNLGSSGWVQHDLYASGSYHADFSFALYGEVNGAPLLSSLSDVQLQRSGRLIVAGSGFGGIQASSRVTIGGLDAIVTRWSNTSIHCYVPEAAPLGSQFVQVVTGTGSSARIPLEVTLRQAQGQLNWRFEIDSNYTYNRSGLAPDGSIYVNDVDGLLYKLSPGGALLWVRATGPLGQTIGCEGPVAVGSDGSVYVANMLAGIAANIVSYAPDGTLRWSFADPGGQGVIAGPSLGPDGNVYFATDFSGRGATVLSPSGQLLWSNQGNPQILENGQTGEELAFGPAQLGGTTASRVYSAFDSYGLSVRDQLYAFAMSNGSQAFAVNTGAQSTILSQRQGQPVVGPNGQILLCSSWYPFGWALSAFDPSNGAVLWNYIPWPHNGMSEPVVGPDGASYLSHSASYLACVNPDGRERWSLLDANASFDAPVLSPDGRELVVSGQSLLTYESFVRSYRAGGSLAWTFDLGTEGGARLAASTRARISSDSATAYLGVWLAPGSGTDPHSYLYAFDVRELVGQPYCFGDGSLATACPCGNTGAIGHGCQNSAATGGALLYATGTTSPDTVVLHTSGELPAALTIVIQCNHDISAGVVFGDGVRCATGLLERLYIQHASGGAVVAPAAGDASIRARSAALGDTIPNGGTRVYCAYYRDPAPGFCPAPAGATFNVTNGVKILWQ